MLDTARRPEVNIMQHLACQNGCSDLLHVNLPMQSYCRRWHGPHEIMCILVIAPASSYSKQDNSDR